MGQDIEVVQDVYVIGVEATLAGARVVLGSGDEPIARIDYRFVEADRARQLDILRRWSDDRLPVTFVRRHGQVALVDDRALLHRTLT
ncbi:MAG: hypothetical protein ACRD0A_16485 [Acidimicrobiales bacterium]